MHRGTVARDAKADRADAGRRRGTSAPRAPTAESLSGAGRRLGGPSAGSRRRVTGPMGPGRAASGSSDRSKGMSGRGGGGGGSIDVLGGLGGAGLSDATIGGVNLSDMVDGRGQWRNISPAVRAALRALFNTVLAQGEKISDLQKVVAGKPDFDYVERLTADLTGIDAFDAHVADVQRQLGDKVGHTDLVTALNSASEDREASRGQLASNVGDRLVTVEAALEKHARSSTELAALVRRKADMDSLRRYALKDELRGKVDVAQLQDSLAVKADRSSVESALEDMASRRDLEAALSTLSQKAGKVEVVDFVESKVQELTGQVQLLQRRLEASQQERETNPVALASDLEILSKDMVTKKDLSTAVSKRVSAAAMETRLAQAHEQMAREISRDLHITLKENHEELVAVLNRKAYKSDVHRALQARASADEVERALATKADGAAMATQLRRKADAGEVASLRSALESITRDDGWRGTIARLETGMRHKVSRTDFDELSARVDAKLESLAQQRKSDAIGAALATAMSPGAHDGSHGVPRSPTRGGRVDIETTPRRSHGSEPELPSGRWIWKSRSLAPDGTVPWEFAAVNTDPENLCWSENQEFVVAARAGLYEVVAGFFSSKPPTITLVVNGSEALTKPNPATESEVQRFEHPDGSISGITLLEFMALPAMAEVSIRYSGEEDGQGFIGLRKL